MYGMRLDLPKYMERRGMKNAYALMRASNGRLTITTASRLVASEGRPKRVDLNTLETLCHMFGATPDELLIPDVPIQRQPAPPSGKPSLPKRKSR